MVRPGLGPYSLLTNPKQKKFSLSLLTLFSFFPNFANHHENRAGHSVHHSTALIPATVILLCFGQLIESSDKPVPRCHQPDVLYSFLEDSIIRYNRSYPYVDPTTVLSPVLDLMLGTGDSGLDDTNADLMSFWLTVCKAKDLDQEIEAWKILAREIIHRMQTDQSVYQISTLLFGDRMGRLLVTYDQNELGLHRNDYKSLDICALQHTNHCGPLFSYGFKYVNTFDSMCILGLKADVYANAAQEVCKDYNYISHPIRELS
ncbi:Vacuolar-processing enzyme [Bienertia sinuspersici]